MTDDLAIAATFASPHLRRFVATYLLPAFNDTALSHIAPKER